MEWLKAKRAFFYHSQYSAFAIIMHKLTGTREYGCVWDFVLSHDIYGPTQIAYVPQDIDLLKDIPCLTTLHVHSSQCEDIVVRVAEVGSLDLVGLHKHAADDPCVMALKRFRPNLRVVTK